MKKFWVTFLVAFLVTCLNPVQAEQNDLLELLKVLKDNGTITAGQYERLKNGIEKNEAEKKARAGVQAGGDDPKPAISDVEVGTSSGQYTLELGGRLMLDAAYYDEDKTDLGDGTELRRARVDLEGEIAPDWEYEFSIDFADSSADVKDAYVRYDAIGPVKLLVGQFKEPFSLEELTSSRYITFMERSLPNEFVPGRSIGVGIRSRGYMWSAAAGIFGEAFDNDADDEGDEGWGVTGRVTFSPLHSKTRALHLGAAASFRTPDDEEEIRFRQRPESHVTNIRYIDTGKIKNTEDFSTFGLEAAGVFGPFSLQGEFIHTDLSRGNETEDASFHGWYLYGSWFVTGESRPYKKKKGVFGRIKPEGKYGALEMAARYSMMDLNDGPITGGEAENITLGVNWYMNPYIRMMANYIWVDNDENADSDGDVTANDDPQIFQTRFQIDF